jgi:hypothetical protein
MKNPRINQLDAVILVAQCFEILIYGLAGVGLFGLICGVLAWLS